MMQQAAAGAGGATLDVDNVFSTYLYTGNDTTRSITNGIDLSGEGGLVWFKSRTTTTFHGLFDTERGATKRLRSDSANAEDTLASDLTAFNSDGFTLGNGSTTNTSPREYASWTFRKAPKWFNIVTYTGTGVNRTISHDLGSTPGMIIVKRTDSTSDWAVYHRGLNGGTNPATKFIRLNLTNAESANAGYWNNTEPTDSVFTVGSNAATNSNGGTYVAYLFAHNNSDGGFGPDSDQDIIKCGSYTGNGSSDGPEINLGFEPQWLLTKRADTSGSWQLHDSMRGVATGGSDNGLRPDVANAESSADYFAFTSTGFKLESTSNTVNGNNGTFIYIAIRRGPLAAPEDATEVFDVVSYTADNTDGRVIATNNRVDTVFARNRNNTSERGFNVGDRLRGLDFLGTAVTFAEGGDSDSFMGFDHQYGFEVGNDGTRRLNFSNYTQIAYSWTKSPNFFDNVAYTGTGSAQNITHNLGVTPEFYIVKRRDSTGAWYAYHKSIDKDGDGLPETDAIQFNGNSAAFDSASYWNDTAPTATTFTVGTTSAVNASGGTYIAYLFASLDGIAKVGGYTGNGTSQTINCGFAPRFVFLTKWGPVGGGNKLVWDTERGIVAGNDPFLDFRNSNAEDSSYDFIDPDSNGFVISGTSGWVNASGSGYMFYAIA